MRRFAFRLAVKLGHIDVDRMLASISCRQLLEWMAFSRLEPFDEEREDIRNASVVAAIYNVNRDTKKRKEPYGWSDFVIPFGDYVRNVVKPTWQDLKAKLRAMYDDNVADMSRKEKRKLRG